MADLSHANLITMLPFKFSRCDHYHYFAYILSLDPTYLTYKNAIS